MFRLPLLFLSLNGCLLNEDLYGLRLAALQDGDHDGFSEEEGDCDDQDPTRSPQSPEVCDGVDDNCNGSIDEGEGDITWYNDGDQDGFGDPLVTVNRCTQPGATYIQQAGDCDDGTADVSPAAEEYCNGIDDDCNGVIDEASAVDVTTWYADRDADGWGDASDAVIACAAPSAAYVAEAGDCNDGNPAIHPDAVESCDGVDNDCDALVDDPPLVGGDVWYPDADDDGFGDMSAGGACVPEDGWVMDTQDCDDADPLVHPGVEESCNDGVDNNCDGSPDPCFWPPEVSMPAGLRIVAAASDDQVGIDGTVGDMNGDGVAELWIGAPTGYNPSSPRDGYADGFLTPLTTDRVHTTAELRIHGEGGVGGTMGAGDLNGDGYDDIAVGAVYGTYRGGAFSGRMHTLLGPISGEYSADDSDQTVVGASSGYLLAGTLGVFPDVSGDGRDDVLVGSYTHVESEHWGVIHLLDEVSSGTAFAESVAVATFYGTQDPEGYFGHQVAVGDYDGDGQRDIGICSGYFDTGLYVFTGDAGGFHGRIADVDAQVRFNTGSSSFGAAWTAQSIGDVNGDGVDDLMTSDSYANELFLIWGGAGLVGTSLADVPVKIRSTGSIPSFGFTSYALGDLNGDDVPDIGAAGYAYRGSDLGVFYGPFDTAGTYIAETEVDIVLHGDGVTDDAYSLMKNVGDVTGDTVPDLLVGSTYHGGTSDPSSWYWGIAYIVPGVGF